MKLQAYTVLDQKTGAYSPPYFMVNDQTAIRMFANTTNDKTSMVHQNPEDFSLHNIGDYDDKTATLTSTKIRSLGVALSFKKQPQATEFQNAIHEIVGPSTTKQVSTKV